MGDDQRAERQLRAVGGDVAEHVDDAFGAPVRRDEPVAVHTRGRRLLPDQAKGEEGYVIDTPMPDSRIELGDLLLVVGTNEAIEAIGRLS